MLGEEKNRKSKQRSVREKYRRGVEMRSGEKIGEVGREE